MNAPARPPRFFRVPAGQKASTCNGKQRGGICEAPIYWIENPDTGKRLPIDCDVDGGHAPSETNDLAQLDVFGGSAHVFDGQGVIHFLTCPDRDKF